MFSPALEIVLTVAYREATARRHTHLTLEHLLYALAHDPDGERILTACGADMPQLRRDSRQVPPGFGRAIRARPAERARTNAGVPARAADGGAARPERGPSGSAFGRRHRRHAAAEPLACGAVALRAGHHPARRPRIHHARKDEAAASVARRSRHRRGRIRRRIGRRRPRRRHRARPTGRLRHRPDRQSQGRRARSADRPYRRAPAHDGDPLPAAQEQSGVRRRRGRGQDRACRRPCHPAPRRRRSGSARGRRGLLARHRRAPGRHALSRRLRGTFQGRHPRALEAPDADPLHRRDPLHGRRRRHDRRHDGPRDAHQADPDDRPAAPGRLDDARRVQAHREGSRARAAAAEDRHRRAVDSGDRAHPAGVAHALRRPPPRALRR